MLWTARHLGIDGADDAGYLDELDLVGIDPLPSLWIWSGLADFGRRLLPMSGPGAGKWPGAIPGQGSLPPVHLHHIQYWSNGGRTKLDNLISLCKAHHRLVHDRGYLIAAARDGTFAFYRHDGTAFPASPIEPQEYPSLLRGYAVADALLEVRSTRRAVSVAGRQFARTARAAGMNSASRRPTPEATAPHRRPGRRAGRYWPPPIQTDVAPGA